MNETLFTSLVLSPDGEHFPVNS